MLGWFRKPPADPSPASRGPSCLSSPLLFGCSHFDYYNRTTLERNGRPSLATTVGLASRGRVKGRLPLLTGLEDSTHAGSSLDITVPFCRCLRCRPLIGGPPKRKVWSLYTVLQKTYYALEHLDDLFRLSSTRSVLSRTSNVFAGWASGSVCYWSPPKLSKLQVQNSYKTCLLSWGLWGPRSRPNNRPLLHSALASFRA